MVLILLVPFIGICRQVSVPEDVIVYDLKVDTVIEKYYYCWGVSLMVNAALLGGKFT